MRRTQADRQAEAARYQQMTEQAQLHPQLVQCRKTGAYYDPQAAFDELMQRRETMAALERLSIR